MSEQPRDPKGSPTGGQWTDTKSGGSTAGVVSQGNWDQKEKVKEEIQELQKKAGALVAAKNYEQSRDVNDKITELRASIGLNRFGSPFTKSEIEARAEVEPSSKHGPVAVAGKEVFEAPTVADDAETNAIHRYTTNYSAFNVGLRAGKGPGPNTKLLDEFIKKAPPLSKDTILLRGVSGDFAKTLAVEGLVFKEKGFTSTTGSLSTAKGFSEGDTGKGAVIRILARAGTQGIATQGVNNRAVSNEQEFILPRNSQFRVVKVSDSGVRKFIDVELI
jgi:hypothetical protein